MQVTSARVGVGVPITLVYLINGPHHVTDTIDGQPMATDTVLAAVVVVLDVDPLAVLGVTQQAVGVVLKNVCSIEKLFFLQTADGMPRRHALFNAPQLQRFGIRSQDLRTLACRQQRPELCGACLLRSVKHDRRTSDVFVGRCNVRNGLGGEQGVCQFFFRWGATATGDKLRQSWQHAVSQANGEPRQRDANAQPVVFCCSVHIRLSLSVIVHSQKVVKHSHPAVDLYSPIVVVVLSHLLASQRTVERPTGR